LGPTPPKGTHFSAHGEERKKSQPMLCWEKKGGKKGNRIRLTRRERRNLRYKRNRREVKKRELPNSLPYQREKRKRRKGRESFLAHRRVKEKQLSHGE